jgi:hypothetical protein
VRELTRGGCEIRYIPFRVSCVAVGYGCARFGVKSRLDDTNSRCPLRSRKRASKLLPRNPHRYAPELLKAKLQIVPCLQSFQFDHRIHTNTGEVRIQCAIARRP